MLHTVLVGFSGHGNSIYNLIPLFKKCMNKLIFFLLGMPALLQKKSRYQWAVFMYDCDDHLVIRK